MSGYIHTLPLLFAQIVRKFPDRPALRFATDHATSYRELDELSANLAGALAGVHGVGLGDVVAISADKSLWCYAGVLAVLKSGATYVMLDPESPTDRLARIFGTCHPKLVLGDTEFLARLAEDAGLSSIALAGQAALSDGWTGGFQGTPRELTGDDPAYVMYTSGSTGIPKGATMTHANVLNFVDWSRTTYDLVPEDVLTNLNPAYFDNSVFDIYSSLFTGASLVPFTKSETRDPGLLVRKLDSLGCTVWFSVPSLLMFLQAMRATDGKRLRSVRRFVFGGEGYPKAKLHKLYAAYKDTASFHNVYGPTECTCICSSYRLTDSDFDDLDGLPPLGHLAPNFRGLVVDEAIRPLPDGQDGELCLLGPNVGKGYFNDPERTAAAFVQSPARSTIRETMYRTGDLARRDPATGMYHILGRRDNQIKHMGHRIELEEIESALHRLEGVEQAAVVHTLATGQSRIIATVATCAPLRESSLKDDLRDLVPDYMVPTTIQFLSVLPKNANGKVDRRRILEEFLESEKVSR